MSGETEPKRFRLAPMSPLIRTVTRFLLALPPAFLVASLVGPRLLAATAFLLLAIYAWIWLRFRPSEFIVHHDRLEVRWPLKHREIPRNAITRVRVIDGPQLVQEIGCGMRVGAGGLWGGFGWLWTTRRGIVQMYVSHTDGYVWIECAGTRPWLITPDQPETFVRAVTSMLPASKRPRNLPNELRDDAPSAAARSVPPMA